MIDVKEVDKDQKTFTLSCKECSNIYKVHVQIHIQVGQYHPQKWKRVDEFIETHAECQPVKRSSSSTHPIIEKAIELFDPISVKHYPYMDSI